MKVIIVGGVAGGATAAARIRRLDESAQIVMFERSGYVSYANCGLPYYIGGVIEDEGELTLQTPQSFRQRFAVDVRVRHEVTAIDPAAKTVTVRNLTSGEVWEESYDKLVLAPGAKPSLPNFSGIDEEGVFTLRTVEDTLRIKRFVEAKQPKTAVLAGGGFISLEMAENLSNLGVQVTIAQAGNQLMDILDADMACFVHNLLRQKGIKLQFGSRVSGLACDDDGTLLTLLDGQVPLKSDMVLLAIGVTPDTALASAAGLRLGMRGSIEVNERMETSARDIYAVGDAVQINHLVTGQPSLVSLAGPANKQARIAADNICGGDSRYLGAQGSSVLKLFDMTVAATGINEKTAKELGVIYDKVVLGPNSHATYYPGAQVMTVKVLYEQPTLRLLGAQIIGGDGVDKRIDVLATAMQAGLTAVQLKDLDLAYAPPYSSAKDPVNMVGFMVENLQAGLFKQFHYEDIAKLPRDGSVTLLDTRTEAEYQRGHIEGFINIPLHTLRDRMAELPTGKPVYVNCHSGLRSYIACRMLAQNGYDCYNFSGGYRFYDANHREAQFGEQIMKQAYPCGMEK
ncbi:MAG: FAD-dependent oxidoreductase [Firmicutes bacterium]|nr:FAD-dependent oxidoreductase [Bacillota bacterium]